MFKRQLYNYCPLGGLGTLVPVEAGALLPLPLLLFEFVEGVYERFSLYVFVS